MVAGKEDIFFEQGVLHLICVDEDVLSDAFDGEEVVGRESIFEFCEVNFAKGASSQDRYEVEIFYLYRRRLPRHDYRALPQILIIV